VDQKHRVVGFFSYRFPYAITAGTLIAVCEPETIQRHHRRRQHGDGATNDRPVINGVVIGKSAFRGTPTREVSAFVEKDIRFGERIES